MQLDWRRLRDHAATFGSLSFSWDGRLLAFSHSNKLVCLVAASTGETLVNLTVPDPQPVFALCFRPGDDLLAGVSGNHVLWLWDLRRLRSELAQIDLDWIQSVP